ncbi:MAG: hypothetical protein J1F09_04935 [Oscillospiraceae bacterium]|nr:hypothetical protein [Oscillospiraceae bacterium]
MKTVLVDNSLCAFTLRDDAEPEHIYNYIRALGEAGVRYVELDFRTLMKLGKLPRGVGYIFRLVDPMFMSLTELYDFDYMLLTFPDLRKNIKTPIPVMLGFPDNIEPSNKAYQYARHLLDGEITAVRIRRSFDMMSHGEAFGYVNYLKNIFPVPIDICPTNEGKTALDCAVKLSAANIDTLTLTMGHPERFCSLDEYLFTLLTVFDRLPNEYNLSALCKVSVFQRFIFRNCSGDEMLRMMDLLDHDIHFLRNVDTGGRVPLRVTLKAAAYLQKTFVSALDKMAREEEIPEDVFEDLREAMNRFDVSFFNENILRNKRRTFLN